MLIKKNFRKKNIYPMIKWAKDLFPICRSITGQGLRDTLNYLKKINPSLNILSFRSGTKVFDWVVPDEWNIKDAYIEHESGKKFAEFRKNNLHIISYSVPINKILNKERLLPYIHTLPRQPDAVPYVTSYYNRTWGFCMTHNDKKKLPKGKYKVYVNSSFSKKGSLEIGEAILRGKNKNEIFFSTNVCHPSMANNELSGPVLLSAILKYLKNNHQRNNYTYRFVFLPETIGSIAYLANNYKKLKQNVIAGFNLSCVGDNRSYSHILSRKGNSLADHALEAGLIGKKNSKVYSYLSRGSDERQYCSPGIDLPVSGFCRTKYGQFLEYHTNKDNFKVVSSRGLNNSLEFFITIIDSFELGLFPKTTIFCEPMMTKRGLYLTLSKKDNKTEHRKIIDVLTYSDGESSIFDIAKKVNLELNEINQIIRKLKKYKILV